MQGELNYMTQVYPKQLNQMKIEKPKHVLMDQYCVSLTMSMFPSLTYTKLHQSSQSIKDIIK